MDSELAFLKQAVETGGMAGLVLVLGYLLWQERKERLREREETKAYIAIIVDVLPKMTVAFETLKNIIAGGAK